MIVSSTKCAVYVFLLFSSHEHYGTHKIRHKKCGVINHQIKLVALPIRETFI